MRLKRLLGLTCCWFIACGGKLDGQMGGPDKPGAGASGAATSVDKQAPDNSSSNPVPIEDPGSGTTTGGGGLPTGTGAAGSSVIRGSAGTPAPMLDSGPAPCFSGPELPVAPCDCPFPQIDVWYCVTRGHTVSVTVGPDGGELTMLDAADGCKNGVPFSLTIPPGALKQPVTISIAETVLPPKRFEATTPGYVVQPFGLQFAIPVALHVPWGNVNSGTQGFSIYTAPSTCAEPTKLPDSYVNAGFLQGTTQGLGIFFAGTPNG